MLAILMIVLGALRVVPALVCREAFGAEATVATVMIALGAIMVVRPVDLCRRWGRTLIRLARRPSLRL